MTSCTVGPYRTNFINTWYCQQRKYPYAIPLAYIPPTSVGNYYTPPAPPYAVPKTPFNSEQLMTPQVSYLNQLANESDDHPLKFMAWNNLQR